MLTISAFDLNDPRTRQHYDAMLLFKNSSSEVSFVYPAGLDADDRKIIHTLAHHMNLHHRSEGTGSNRTVTVSRLDSGIAANPPPPLLTSNHYASTQSHRLPRAATTDFSLARQPSGHLDVSGGPPGFFGHSHGQNLRNAKSFADLRSSSSSPVPSGSPFTATLAQNASRYNEYSHSVTTPGSNNLSATSGSGDRGFNDDAYTLPDFQKLSISIHDRPSNSMRVNGGRIGQERESYTVNAGPIGSHRPVNGSSYEDAPRNGATVITERQPRGPPVDRSGVGFGRPRQNGHMTRGSGKHILKWPRTDC